MAYYNANRVIKLTRKALGITQEKLSEGVCEVETYSRIENGHRTIRRNTYQKLMEKMGRNTERRYAVCVSKDGMLLEEKIELERAFKRYDYEAAEKYLNILKEKVDDNLLTRQYMSRVEALVEYYRGRCREEELISKLGEALKITVPEYERYLVEDIVYPFTKMELLILLNIGNAYRRMGDNARGELLYQIIIKCLNASYLGERDNTNLQVSVGRSLAKAYAEAQNSMRALEVIDECLEIAINSDYGCKIAAMLVSKANNYVVLVHHDELSKEYLEVASKCLRQAYYLAAARNEHETAEKVKSYYSQYFENKL